MWPQPISCLVQGGKSEIFITMHIHFLNTNESFYLNTNDHSEGRKENIFLLMNFSVYIVLESGKKKISIRDALATSYIVQHRNQKKFPINVCIYQVAHATPNNTGLHQLTPTTTKVQLSTAYNNS